ncbi:MAG: hypothetical protein OER22_08790 [Gammaproteobacteria bacterium]|nr:hypothetical protein [Gammaproteobacteria bacterium]MDH3372624.1 hypothetical protein [Gammaproteobacteria bacterium]MDH3552695.1 hypothetical protein [Gammaproteobacteria bacterium]
MTASVGVAVVTLLALMYWYQWSARTLTLSEVDAYMAEIEAQTQNPGPQHDLPALRKFLEEDDGKPIYTANMYDFKDVADYPEDSGFSGSGEEAYDRFSSVMIPLMTKRGSHPIYGSNWADEANSKWDRIVIVRYRSRRDLADLFATEAFAEASLHKWASLRKHERMLVQALHIPDGRYIAMLIAMVAGVVVYAASRILLTRKWRIELLEEGSDQ